MTAFEAGTEVAGYRVRGPLGRGGMGSLYLAEDLTTDRTVVLKALPDSLAGDASLRRRFLREARYAAAVAHPNVVQTLASGEEAGVPYLVMTHVDGEDLHALLVREGPLSRLRALRTIEFIGRGLDAIHAVGLVHRDVKPANVLLARDGRVYITDFGLSSNPEQDSGALTAVGDFVGTCAYVAPEQVLGAPAAPAADVYSLGALLCDLLTGKPPFVYETAAETLTAHVDEPPPRVSDRPPGLPAAFDAVLARALAKDPAERYGTCRELVAAARTALRVPVLAVSVELNGGEWRLAREGL